MPSKQYEIDFSGQELAIIPEPALSAWIISGTGQLEIMNTGGSSAAEGGMGSGGGPEKGPGIKETETGTESTDEKTGNSDSDDETWDPLKPKEEKEKK